MSLHARAIWARVSTITWPFDPSISAISYATHPSYQEASFDGLGVLGFIWVALIPIVHNWKTRAELCRHETLAKKDRQGGRWDWKLSRRAWDHHPFNKFASVAVVNIYLLVAKGTADKVYAVADGSHLATLPFTLQTRRVWRWLESYPGEVNDHMLLLSDNTLVRFDIPCVGFAHGISPYQDGIHSSPVVNDGCQASAFEGVRKWCIGINDRTNKLIVQNRRSWICTVSRDDLFHKNQYTHHFFVPEGNESNTGHTPPIRTRDNSIILSRHSEVLVVKNGLNHEQARSFG